jgi:arylsulfatase A-like enzyme
MTRMPRGNVLLITVDQLRADILQSAGGFMPTPNLDRLAAGGLRFSNHSTVTVPCGPARASLLTGLYAMNHRSIRNGTPLASHHATIATEARKAGYEPLLFGYSDTTPDPTGIDPEDPVLASYEGVAPGFRELVEMRLDTGLEWPAYLKSRGYRFSMDDSGPVPEIFRPVPQNPGAAGGNAPKITDPALYAAQDSDTAYLADRTMAALDIRSAKPWFAHVTFIRPHPPLVAPAPYNAMFHPDALPSPDLAAPAHPFVDAWFSAPCNKGLYWGFDGDCAGLAPEQAAAARAVYCGLIAEVDHHIGRMLDWLDDTGQAGDTLVIVTADHGEMLGEKRMWGKESVFDAAFRVPLVIRDPRRIRHAGSVIGEITESVDIAPTILEWIGREAPPAFDGKSLLAFLDGEVGGWRNSCLMEADFSHPLRPTRFQRALGLDANSCNATILREKRWKYVHFGGGVPPMLFDLAADPGETTDLGREAAATGEIARLARRLLDRMNERRDRRLTGFAFDP